MNSIFKQSLTLDELAHEKRFSTWVLIVSILTGLLGAYAFVENRQLDFILTDWINQHSVFALSGSTFWAFVRRAMMIGFGIAYVLFILGLIRSITEKRPIWKMPSIAWLYLVVCSLVGPLLVANLILKTYVGRPRPRSVTEYGGQLDFLSVFEAGGKCVDNCSFVSGEVSSMVMIFAALMFACKPLRLLFASLLVPAWALSGYIRIGMGAHFPSDTFFAGIFMIAIAAGLYRLMVLSPRNVSIRDQ